MRGWNLTDGSLTPGDKSTSCPNTHQRTRPDTARLHDEAGGVVAAASALNTPDQHARAADGAQVMAELPPQQQRKFGGLFPNPVVCDTARIFSACLPWRHRTASWRVLRPMLATSQSSANRKAGCPAASCHSLFGHQNLTRRDFARAPWRWHLPAAAWLTLLHGHSHERV